MWAVTKGTYSSWSHPLAIIWHEACAKEREMKLKQNANRLYQ